MSKLIFVHNRDVGQKEQVFQPNILISPCKALSANNRFAQTNNSPLYQEKKR